MRAVKLGPSLRLFWRLHKWILRVSRGRLLARVDGLPVLVLHTVGRSTGQPRMNALSYVREGENFVVVGSYAGAEVHPAWYLNLKANPETFVDVRGKRIRVKMNEASGQQAQDLYARFVQIQPGYAEYQKRTERKIPVVVLQPLAV
jgi:deazaflavin-dependent oxidoreductase (nitroreductase family)